MKKQRTIWLIVALVVIIAGGLAYMIWKNKASADVADSSADQVGFTYQISNDCGSKTSPTFKRIYTHYYKAKVGETLCVQVNFPKTDNKQISNGVIGYQNESAGKAFSSQVKGSSNNGSWYQIKGLQVGRGTYLFTRGIYASFFMIDIVSPSAISPTPVPSTTDTPGPTIGQYIGYPYVTEGNMRLISTLSLLANETAYVYTGGPSAHAGAVTIANSTLASASVIKTYEDGQEDISVSSKGVSGDTTLQIVRGSDVVSLPITISNTVSSGVVVLKTYADLKNVRDTQQTIKVGEKLTLDAHWPPVNGIEIHDPTISDSGVISSVHIGSSTDGVAVQITAEKTGTATVTFNHGSDKTVFTVNVQ